MNQYDRSISSVGIGALLAAALAAVFSLLSMITGVSFLCVLAIVFAALGVVFVILILSRLKAGSGSAASAPSAPAENNVRDAIRRLERMTEGDFSDETPFDASDPLLCAVARLRDTFGGVMSGVSEDTAAISDSGAQLSSASERLSQGFFRQGEMLGGIYDSVTTVSKAAAKNAEIAREANGFAAAAADDVQKGSDQMQELLGAMDEINRSTDEIAKFIKTIEDIAFQTNILALNSSVEAAHAGEAGKGFAVVATEVKTLANRSQETAKNTNRLIQSCVASARIGVEKTGAAVKALAAASEETRSVRGLIDVISRECDTQSNSIGKINQDFAQIGGIMKSVNAAASECSERIQALSGHSDRLRNDLKDFKGTSRSHASRSAGTAPSENTAADSPQLSAVKSETKTASAVSPAKPSAPAPAPKPAAKTTGAVSTAKPSAPAPKPAAKTASAVGSAKPSAPVPKPAAKTASAVSPAKPSAPVPKPAAKTASPVSSAKPSAPAPKPAAKTTSPISSAKPSAPAPKPAAPAPRSTSMPKAPAQSASAASSAVKKSEPMPTSLPEKFEAVKFVDIPDSKY